MDSTSKNQEDAATNFVLYQMTLKDNTVVEMDMDESEKAKAESVEPKTTEAAGVSKDDQPGQAAMEVTPEKVANQSWKAKMLNRRVGSWT